MKAVWFLSCLLAGTPFTDGINDNKPVPQDKIVYLYPEGQGVDKGIEENGIKITSGPAIDKPGDLAAILTNLNENDILFIDEIHRLNHNVEEILYHHKIIYMIHLHWYH